MKLTIFTSIIKLAQHGTHQTCSQILPGFKIIIMFYKFNIKYVGIYFGRKNEWNHTMINRNSNFIISKLTITYYKNKYKLLKCTSIELYT